MCILHRDLTASLRQCHFIGIPPSAPSAVPLGFTSYALSTSSVPVSWQVRLTVPTLRAYHVSVVDAGAPPILRRWTAPPNTPAGTVTDSDPMTVKVHPSTGNSRPASALSSYSNLQALLEEARRFLRHAASAVVSNWQSTAGAVPNCVCAR